MHPDTAAQKVEAAHSFVAEYIIEHGDGPHAEVVRNLSGVPLSGPAREVRDAAALAAIVELLAAGTKSAKAPAKKASAKSSKK
jgi:hypothetical protein